MTDEIEELDVAIKDDTIVQFMLSPTVSLIGTGFEATAEMLKLCNPVFFELIETYDEETDSSYRNWTVRDACPFTSIKILQVPATSIISVGVVDLEPFVSSYHKSVDATNKRMEAPPEVHGETVVSLFRKPQVN